MQKKTTTAGHDERWRNWQVVKIVNLILHAIECSWHNYAEANKIRLSRSRKHQDCNCRAKAYSQLSMHKRNTKYQSERREIWRWVCLYNPIENLVMLFCIKKKLWTLVYMHSWREYIIIFIYTFLQTDGQLAYFTVRRIVLLLSFVNLSFESLFLVIGSQNGLDCK